MSSPTLSAGVVRRRLALLFPLAKAYIASTIAGIRQRQLLDSVETYCMFVGYPRSGHSLIGALLDAHPHVVVAHELNALMYIRAGFSRRQILALLLERSREFSATGNRWSGYTYRVPNQYQGSFKSLKIIGDKQGGISAQYLYLYPDLFGRLLAVMGPETKFIHVIRNPFDNITTMFKRETKPSLAENIDLYFELCSGVAGAKQQVHSPYWHDLHFESFVGDPAAALQSLCRFLNVPAAADYVQDCAGIVFSSPRQTRHSITWSPADRQRVMDECRSYPFLSEYTFDE